jgi:hypothetical protein
MDKLVYMNEQITHMANTISKQAYKIGQMTGTLEAYEQTDRNYVCDKNGSTRHSCRRCGARSTNMQTAIKHDKTCIYALLNEQKGFEQGRE